MSFRDFEIRLAFMLDEFFSFQDRADLLGAIRVLRSRLSVRKRTRVTCKEIYGRFGGRRGR